MNDTAQQVLPPAPVIPLEPMYTVEQVARAMQLCEDTIRREARQGHLKGMRFGGTWRFTPGQIEAFKRDRMAR